MGEKAANAVGLLRSGLLLSLPRYYVLATRARFELHLGYAGACEPPPSLGFLGTY